MKKVIIDILQWDINSWNTALQYWENVIDWNKVNAALEIGSKSGGLSLWLGLKNINTTCSDLTNTKETASILHEKYNLVNKIKYQDINALNIPYENHFDVIVFKSIIGGIGRDNNFDNQVRVFEQIHKALKPGGYLLFAENLVASKLHKFLRKRFVKWGNYWKYLTIDELNILTGQFATKEMKTTGFVSAFGRTEQQRKYFSYFDKILFNHIFPKRWHYIAYGYAQKSTTLPEDK